MRRVAVAIVCLGLTGGCSGRGSVETASIEPSSRSGEVAVDLVAGALNGRPFYEYTQDEIVATLGKPSAASKPREIISRFGSHLKYHSLGMGFHFAHPDDDKELHCTGFYLHLSRKWDQDSTRWFSAFRGTIDRGVDGSWTADSVLYEFGSLGAYDNFDEEEYKKTVELHEQLKSWGVKREGDDDWGDTWTVVNMWRNGFVVGFGYDLDTRLLKRVGVNRVAPREPS